jgi:hypothetical protein
MSGERDHAARVLTSAQRAAVAFRHATGPEEVARILAEYGVREAAAADTIIDMPGGWQPRRRPGSPTQSRAILEGTWLPSASCAYSAFSATGTHWATLSRAVAADR